MEDTMSNGENGYILTEISNARPAWRKLSNEERRCFFDEKVNRLLGRMLEEGAEFLGCAVNNTGPERIGYR